MQQAEQDTVTLTWVAWVNSHQILKDYHADDLKWLS